MLHTAYDTAATIDLVNALRAHYGLDVTAARAARAALAANGYPNALLVDLETPELDRFPFPALAYSAVTALSPQYTQTDRLAFLHDLIDRGVDRAQAAALLLAVYGDLWHPKPSTRA